MKITLIVRAIVPFITIKYFEESHEPKCQIWVIMLRFLRLYHFKQKAIYIVRNRCYIIMFSMKFHSVDVLLLYINITVINYPARHHVLQALFPLYIEEFSGPCHGNIAPCKLTAVHVEKQIWKTSNNSGCAGALKFLPLLGNQILLQAPHILDPS
jgi:hypothetical protein